jgi:hypothetical protein
MLAVSSSLRPPGQHVQLHNLGTSLVLWLFTLQRLLSVPHGWAAQCHSWATGEQRLPLYIAVLLNGCAGQGTLGNTKGCARQGTLGNTKGCAGQDTLGNTKGCAGQGTLGNTMGCAGQDTLGNTKRCAGQRTLGNTMGCAGQGTLGNTK